MLPYSVVFINKINLISLHHWQLPGKLTNFSTAALKAALHGERFLSERQLKNSF